MVTTPVVVGQSRTFENHIYHQVLGSGVEFVIFFYNGKIPNFLNLTREKLVNRHIFGKKLRMEDVLLIFEQIFALALLVALVTNYTSGFNMKGRSHSSIFAVQT